MMKFLKNFSENPWVNLISGLVLVYTSGIEVFDSLDEEFKAGVHHGVFLFGIIQLLRSLPEFVEGATRIREGKEKKS